MTARLNAILAAMGLTALLVATQAAAQITFYEGEGFRGRTFRTDRTVQNLDRIGFNDRASSVIVDGGRWEVCTDARFEGTCVVLRRGSYATLIGMGIDNRISSLRPISGRGEVVRPAPEPLPAPTYEYRRRPGERTYEVPITSVRAMMGPPEQRCWTEHQPGGGDSAGGAVAGAIIGGILGHQIGGGRGKDAATAAGAIAGAAIGSGRGGPDYGREVERCRTVAGDRPAYWDVTYEFRGQFYHAQLSAPPGRSILVNGRGEPRQ